MMKPVTANDLREIMTQYPLLTSHGFGVGTTNVPRNLDKIAERFALERQKLWGSLERIESACKWIDRYLEPADRINHRVHSYGLKGLAEREIDYITNGQFVAAMIHMGYRVKQKRDCLSGWFNVDHCSVKSYVRLTKYIFTPPNCHAPWHEKTNGGLTVDYGTFIEPNNYLFLRYGIEP